MAMNQNEHKNDDPDGPFQGPEVIEQPNTCRAVSRETRRAGLVAEDAGAVDGNAEALSTPSGSEPLPAQYSAR